ncbi:MAG TPA: zinc ribbon domain-containing protein [Thermoplasmata archaeon]|nr:zinc ribbon domain-containing protein [Thermoplasmata archaeon]
MSATTETAAECPSCHAEVSLDATECPRCGELFEAEAIDAGELADGTKRKAGFREKLLFYAGIALILLGGPGIALGSWLHDVLRISVGNYLAFDAFGGVNRLVVAVGLVVMIVGVVLFILSLRLTRPSEEEREILEARGS